MLPGEKLERNNPGKEAFKKSRKWARLDLVDVSGLVYFAIAYVSVEEETIDRRSTCLSSISIPEIRISRTLQSDYIFIE